MLHNTQSVPRIPWRVLLPSLVPVVAAEPTYTCTLKSSRCHPFALLVCLFFRMNRILLSTPRSVLGNLLSSFQALPVCSMFTWNSSKTAITAASAGLFGMGAIFYFYYYNDDSRISSKKHLRPIEILYHEHENFATLRKNWQIVSA